LCYQYEVLSIAYGIDGKSVNGPDGDRKNKNSKKEISAKIKSDPPFLFFIPPDPAPVNIVGLADDVMQYVPHSHLTPHISHPTLTHMIYDAMHSYTLLKHAVLRAVHQQWCLSLTK
jgi:hypothetical protein